MTETAGTEVVTPKLVHSGTYALYETPDGGRHLANVLRCQKNGCSRQWVHTQTLRSLSGHELDGAA